MALTIYSYKILPTSGDQPNFQPRNGLAQKRPVPPPLPIYIRVPTDALNMASALKRFSALSGAVAVAALLDTKIPQLPGGNLYVRRAILHRVSIGHSHLLPGRLEDHPPNSRSAPEYFLVCLHFLVSHHCGNEDEAAHQGTHQWVKKMALHQHIKRWFLPPPFNKLTDPTTPVVPDRRRACTI
ncbi:hypothetical protein NDU88_003953 [Pleurodeles waltl]|uniref:Uncharacterized protein n=1 Tax=Pleurodeles waltl TaxID=8319 RepID=A0AAV7PFB3_PLEWA|nr:hypothetical protein NDU88_003953 [Pleurodeles waltl]